MTSGKPSIYLPYIVGESSPIPYLFEKISPYLADSYDITIHSTRGDYFEEESIHEIDTVSSNIPKKAYKIALTSIQNHDLIHTGAYGIYHYFASKGAKLRSNSTTHIHTFRVDFDPENWNPEVRRRLGESADRTTAVSEHTAATVESAIGISPEVIYNGVNTDLFSPEKNWPDLFDRLCLNDRIFLFVGSFNQRKRPKHVMEIAKQTPDATFLMAGDGPQFEYIQKEAAGQGNLHLLGNIDKSRLPAIYANVTALLFPTVQEGCPNVVLEAMSSATPVLGYRATSMPELVDENNTGNLVEVDNIDALQSVVSGLEQSRAEKMGRSARSYAKSNHQFDKIARDYMDIYEPVL
ncbi:glycosyltransferase family 4 protein [Haloarcula amylovorans]|uniref:glycosyltransferase family 4 protein n=1 Tax=Haloarcula amylovorans TaxID=2562280 RepID=UPI001076456C|nr:glycosyltransferase family 4 protein [Halomicroarcula amylolytica]